LPSAATFGSEAFGDIYNPVTNPNGYLTTVAVAENLLMTNELLEKFNQCRNITEATMRYTFPKGSPNFREAIADLMSWSFKLKKKLNANNIAVLAGSTAVLDELFTCLCDSTDGVIIPSPYYFGYDSDIRNASIVPAPLTSANNFMLTVEALENALKGAQSKNMVIKAVLITNPNNPTGSVYTPNLLIEVMEFCKKNKLQLVVNELYTNSCFDPKIEHHSVLSLPEYEANRDFVHVIYGFSKDFCINGFRVGVFYTENEELLNAMSICAFYASVSHDTQQLLTNMLLDRQWTENYLQLNKKRLKHAYDYLVELLTINKLDFVPFSGCFFVWLDLRKFLSSPTGKAEDELENLLFYKAKVKILKGQYYHCSEPGYFRISIATSDGDLKLMVDRMVKVLYDNK